MKKYNYLNQHVNIGNGSIQENNDWISERVHEKNGKVLQRIYLPLLLKREIESLPLSRTMMNKAKKCIHIVLQKSFQEYGDASEHVSISSRYLQQQFGAYYHTDFFNLLKERKIIETTGVYNQAIPTSERCSKSYRISQDFLEGNFIEMTYIDNIEVKKHTPLEADMLTDLKRVRFTENTLSEAAYKQLHRINAYALIRDEKINNDCFEVKDLTTNNSSHMTRDKALYYCKANGLSLIKDNDQFVMGHLYEYILWKQKNLLLNYKWHIERLINKDLYVKRNITNNRLDHNLTSLPKTLLQIIMKENDLVEIELCNSQFAIHAYWLKQEGLCKEHEDVRRYYDMCSQGKLYETLAGQMDIPRSDAKQMMIALAFASDKYSNPNKAKFREQFPNVISHIDGFKKEKRNSGLFSVELQQIEAELFVDNLYPLIKREQLFCLTKHDSLIVKSEEADRILEIARSFFNHIKFECALDVEGEKVAIQNDGDTPYKIWSDQ